MLTKRLHHEHEVFEGCFSTRNLSCMFAHHFVTIFILPESSSLTADMTPSVHFYILRSIRLQYNNSHSVLGSNSFAMTTAVGC